MSKKSDREDREWFQVDSIETLINRVEEWFLINMQKHRYEICELRKLADIGRATELALVDGVILTKPNNYNDEYCIGSGILITDVKELLEWAKEQTK